MTWPAATVFAPSLSLTRSSPVPSRATPSGRSQSAGSTGSPETVFEGIDYAALGHLHGPQSPECAPGSVVRYSGSPLRYSFSEQDQVKAVLLVDLPAEGPSR